MGMLLQDITVVHRLLLSFAGRRKILNGYRKIRHKASMNRTCGAGLLSTSLTIGQEASPCCFIMAVGKYSTDRTMEDFFLWHIPVQVIVSKPVKLMLEANSALYSPQFCPKTFHALISLREPSRLVLTGSSVTGKLH